MRNLVGARIKAPIGVPPAAGRVNDRDTVRVLPGAFA